MIHPIILGLFLLNITDPSLAWYEIAGRIFSVGLLNGTCAINVSHELGHRKEWWNRLAADLLLLCSLENHFRPYHNYYHHKHVATTLDFTTAIKGEWCYTFWFREQIGSYLKAWEISKTNALKKGQAPYSIHHYMLVATIAQISLFLLIYLIMGLSLIHI